MTSDEPLRALAAGAATLWERLSGPYRPLDGPESEQLAAARLERWRQKAAGGDREVFRQRLSWLGTTPERAVRALGQVRLEGSLPPWTAVFASAMAAASTASGAAAGPHPFGNVLSPFVQAGLARLSPAAREAFSEAALAALADDLAQQLSHLAAPALYLELAVARRSPGNPAETGAYDTFTAGLLAGGLWGFFAEYPVLARLLAGTVELWVRNVEALAAAFLADRGELARVFGGEVPGRIAALTPSLSDRHDGGRMVASVLLDNGRELFYKPRDLGVEEAWRGLLEHWNGHGGDFRTLRVLAREGHGWAEAARPEPCRDAAEAARFYVRAGRLLCALYVLEASDCFYENVVACGGHPVLVDVETLMHPALRRSAGLSAAEELAGEVVFHSVFRAGFLPSWEASPEGLCVDISGLGARPDQVTPYLRRRWLHVNTDAMRLEHEPIRVESEAHLPRLNGECLAAAGYAPEVVQGFREMYELLLSRRRELAAPGGPLEALLGRREIRVVFHATRIYGLLLKRLGAPRHLRSGVERSLETDLLSRFYLGAAAGPPEPWWRPVLAAELAALERLDIPRFVVRADRRDLPLAGGGAVPEAFAETALDRVRRRLAALSPADLELQTELIRASLSMTALVQHESSVGDAAEPPPPGDGPALAGDDLAAEAAALAAAIERRAIVSPDGGATWIAPQLLPRTSHYALRPLRMDLYNGLAGVALFFAALEQTLGTGRRTALAALAPLRRFLATAGTDGMIREGYTLGAATGAGSFLYALTRCAGFLEMPELLAEAAAAGGRITPEWIADDDRYDVMSGAAGAILGLLALQQASGSPLSLEQPLERAVRCGDHLLAHRRAAGRGAAWPAHGGRCLTGLSHGAAGIALALLRLARATGEGRFREAAEEAIAFEAGAFDEAAGNWPDFRSGPEAGPAFMNAWCHGAAGIGLARAAGLPILDTPAIRQDIEAALTAVSRHGIGDKDGLCCGNLGRADLLLAASPPRAGGERPREALRLASSVAARARRRGGYRTSGPGFFDPSFFQGLSGIGYQLLRLAHPDRIPSVLVWE